jgi:hypothetical protein
LKKTAEAFKNSPLPLMPSYKINNETLILAISLMTQEHREESLTLLSSPVDYH